MNKIKQRELLIEIIESDEELGLYDLCCENPKEYYCKVTGGSRCRNCKKLL